MARSRKAGTGPGDSPHPSLPEPRQVLELWIALARMEWSSLVVVPADPESSSAALARTLADMGQRLSFVPVTAIIIDSLEYGSALALADLQQHIARDRRAPVVEVHAQPADPIPAPASSVFSGQDAQSGQARPTQAQGYAEPIEPDRETDALVIAPNARLIIAIPAVVREPLGLPAAQAADAVILTARMGKSHLRHLRRSVELIGRDRVLGTVLLK